MQHTINRPSIPIQSRKLIAGRSHHKVNLDMSARLSVISITLVLLNQFRWNTPIMAENSTCHIKLEDEPNRSSGWRVRMKTFTNLPSKSKREGRGQKIWFAYFDLLDHHEFIFGEEKCLSTPGDRGERRDNGSGKTHFCFANLDFLNRLDRIFFWWWKSFIPSYCDQTGLYVIDIVNYTFLCFFISRQLKLVYVPAYINYYQ